MMTGSCTSAASPVSWRTSGAFRSGSADGDHALTAAAPAGAVDVIGIALLYDDGVMHVRGVSSELEDLRSFQIWKCGWGSRPDRRGPRRCSRRNRYRPPL